MRQFCKVLVLSALCLGLSACAMPMHEFNIMPPHVSRVSHTYKELGSLPEPKGKIRVSVYNFHDQTGQYKPLANVSSFSTAVTQGGVNMLIQALNQSQWFIPVERDGLQSLLTERKIISASKQRNGGSGAAEETDDGLPPLEWANILLQGGITAYEHNTLTGGFGAEYWGLGGSTLYSMDQVTVHLRAVDVHTGRILKSVSTTKTIFSQEYDAGLFRYLTFRRLLEVEAGFSQNEPVQMCVAAAIEKAVVALVVEGVMDDLWKLKDPEDINSPIFQEYREEAHNMAIAAEVEAEAAKSAAAKKAAVEKELWDQIQEQRAQETDEHQKALEAERQAREAAESKAAQEAERATRLAEEAQAAQETERVAREEAEAKAAQEAERANQLEEEARAAQESERLAREEADARVAQEAERAARLEEEARAAQEAELKAREEEARQKEDLEAERGDLAARWAQLEAERKALQALREETEAREALEGQGQAEESADTSSAAEQGEDLSAGQVQATPVAAVMEGGDTGTVPLLSSQPEEPNQAAGAFEEQTQLKKWEPAQVPSVEE